MAAAPGPGVAGPGAFRNRPRPTENRVLWIRTHAGALGFGLETMRRRTRQGGREDLMESWITTAIDKLGYAGVVLLMFFENLFPPIPSEVVMPLSGYVSAQGGMSLWAVIVAGTVGSVLGAIFWYYVAVWLGEDRLKRWARKHGRWITLGPSDIDKADDWFDRYGAWLVFFGRLVPTVRTLIAIPAGLFGMSIGRYILYTTAGSLIWTGALAVLGWWLGSQWDQISTYLGPVTYAIVGGAIVIYLYRVMTFDRTERKAEAKAATRRP